MGKPEDLDFELIEDDDIVEDEVEVKTDEEATPSDKTKEGSGEDTTPAKWKKNKSNWKKAAKKIQALTEENRKLREWRWSLDDDDDDDDDGETYVSSTEMRLFVVENPEAKEYKDEIESIIEESKGILSFERAFTLAKAERPQESQDEDDFKTKWSNVKVKKRLVDLTEEEALRLPNNKYLEYQRKKGKLK